MRLPVSAVLLGCVALLAVPLAHAQSKAAPETVTATLELSQEFYYAGDPFYVRVSIGNNGDRKIANPVKSPLLAGLKARAGGAGLERKETPADAEPARPEHLAARSFYGAVFDLAQVFPGLAEVGEYEISWSADGVSSRTLRVRMLPKYDPEKRYEARIETTQGTMVIDFYPDTAPVAVKAFVDMANAGFYDGLQFQEVRKDWYIAGGDPRFGEGSRSPVVYPAEVSTLPVVAGSVVMRPVRPSPPANSSLFMILLRPEPSWNGQVTVVGQVTRGLEIASKISQTATSGETSRPFHKPLERVLILGVRIVEKAVEQGS